jgi:hypothetical protein
VTTRCKIDEQQKAIKSYVLIHVCSLTNVFYVSTYCQKRGWHLCRCAFTRGSRGEVMIFFEKNKILGVEPNMVLNILEGI